MKAIINANQITNDKTNQLMDRMAILIENMANAKINCQQCDMTFNYKSDLNVHIKDIYLN